jgi:hypothetical protein
MAARGGGLPITVDGDFADWGVTVAAAADPAGDDGSSGIDFRSLWLAHDQDRLFLRFDTTVEVQPDEQQDIRIYLDTDLNAATGLSIHGMGADLVWELGGRSGTFYTPSARSIDHPDIGLTVAPTVSGTQFEISFARDAVPASGQSLFPGPSCRVVLRDGTGGDALPDAGSVLYTFDGSVFPTASLPLERQDAGHVRIAAYNVQGDGLFDGSSSRQAALGRIFDAVDADVWIVCEVWDHSAEETRQVVEGFLPSGPGEAWYATKRDAGNVIVSRFPILLDWEVNPGYRITGALLDLRPVQDTDLLLVANHWRCCTADDDRQNEADSVVEFLKDAREPGGAFTLGPDTPIVLGGDFNLVGWRQQLQTLVTGDIQDNGAYGPDSPPDWDGSDLAFALSRHPDARQVYTWRNDFSSFYPGLLDYLFYTDSVYELAHGYVLETRTMEASTLAAYGLQADDTPEASDHAPRVGDFALITGTPAPSVLARAARLLPNVPNPFNPRTEVRFALDTPARVRLDVLDARGRRVATLLDAARPAGSQQVLWTGSDDAGRAVASGVYRVRMAVDGVVVDGRAVTLVR